MGKSSLGVYISSLESLIDILKLADSGSDTVDTLALLLKQLVQRDEISSLNSLNSEVKQRLSELVLEVLRLRQYIKQLEADKLDINKRYNQLYLEHQDLKLTVLNKISDTKANTKRKVTSDINRDIIDPLKEIIHSKNLEIANLVGKIDTLIENQEHGFRDISDMLLTLLSKIDQLDNNTKQIIGLDVDNINKYISSQISKQVSNKLTSLLYDIALIDQYIAEAKSSGYTKATDITHYIIDNKQEFKGKTFSTFYRFISKHILSKGSDNNE